MLHQPSMKQLKRHAMKYFLNPLETLYLCFLTTLSTYKYKTGLIFYG